MQNTGQAVMQYAFRPQRHQIRRGLSAAILTFQYRRHGFGEVINIGMI